MKGFVKDPNATLDYSFDWGPWLDGDTIDTSVWIVESPIAPTNEANDTTTTRVFLAGGSHGSNYLITNRITTAGGLTDDRSFEVRVRNR
jgi:hypothetical protein